jgi:dTDP-4-amino-4,6-dideoxygalactose transaminase
MSVSDAARHGAKRVIMEEYLCVGYNYRMTDVQGAIGIEQMRKLDWILERRRQLARQYDEALAGHPWLRAPHVPSYAWHNYQSYAVQLTPDAPLGRNDLMQFLLDRQIATRRGIMLAHREPPYADRPHADLSQSEWASEHSLLLPLFPNMADADVARVVEALDAADVEAR